MLLCKGPKEVLLGVKEALEKYPDFAFTVVGDPALVEEVGLPRDRVNIIESHETVTNYDNPVEAFYKKGGNN